MKFTVKFIGLVLLLMVLVLPLTAFVDSGEIFADQRNETGDIKGDKLVLGGAFTLQKGDTLEGNLFIVGGAATLEEDSIVEKDVMVMGGSLSVEGRIEGNVAVVGGLVTLNDGAVIGGDVNALGGNILQDEGARVVGSMNTDVPGMFTFIVPGRIQIPNLGEWSPAQPGNLRLPKFDVALNPFWDGLWLLLRSFLWAAIAVLAVIFLPKNSERIARAAVSQPVIAGGMGCITMIVAPLVLILLAITICGIPISVFGALTLFVAWAFGIIVLGMEVGKRLAHLVNRDWALPVSASIGTFILTFVLNSIETLVSCIGWLAPALAGVIGLGAVLLSRFGSQDYSPEIRQQTEVVEELQYPSLNTTPTKPEINHGSKPEETSKAEDLE